MSELEIVLFCADHVDDVARIESELNPVPWSRQLFADELSLVESSRHWLVALLDGEVVGFAGSMFVEVDAHLMNLAVDPRHQRQGIGRKLMTQMMLDVRRGGFENMTLEVRPDNEPAIALYREFAMVPAGSRKDYYPDGQDALIMWVHNIDHDSYGQRLVQMAQPC
jgi:ribosomal-protein-alanine N-acetyltransferase